MHTFELTIATAVVCDTSSVSLPDKGIVNEHVLVLQLKK
jgi:hypothetical protein